MRVFLKSGTDSSLMVLEITSVRYDPDTNNVYFFEQDTFSPWVMRNVSEQKAKAMLSELFTEGCASYISDVCFYEEKKHA